MGRKLFVVDLEATAYPDNREFRRDDFKGEIIQIGFCQVDLDELAIGGTTSLYVHPRKTVIGPFIEELTGICPADIDDRGIKLGYAVDIMLNTFDTNKTPWASWGFYDKLKLEEQCKFARCPYPMGKTHYDLKRLWWLCNGLTGRPKGLRKGLAQAGFEFIGEQHRGDVDAYNAARILIEMVRRFRHGV